MVERARRDLSSMWSPDTDDFRKKFALGMSVRDSRSVWLTFRTLYQKNMSMEEVARRDPRRSVHLIQTILEEKLNVYILRDSRSVWLITRKLYQNDMTMLEVARRDTPSSGSDTGYIRKKFEWEYLEKQQICHAENSNVVSGQHDYGRGGTTRPPVERFFWY